MVLRHSNEELALASCITKLVIPHTILVPFVRNGTKNCQPSVPAEEEALRCAVYTNKAEHVLVSIPKQTMKTDVQCIVHLHVLFLTTDSWVRKWGVELARDSQASLKATLCFSFNRGCVCSPHTESLFALVCAKRSHPAVSKHLLESPLYKSLIRVPVSTQGSSAQSRALDTGSNHLATEGGGFPLQQSLQMRNLDQLVITSHRGSSLTGQCCHQSSVSACRYSCLHISDAV